VPPWLFIVGGGLSIGAIIQFLRGRQTAGAPVPTAARRAASRPGITPDEQVEDTFGNFVYVPRPIPGAEAELTTTQFRGRAKTVTTPTVTVTTASASPVVKPGPAPTKPRTVAAPKPAARPAPKPAARPAPKPVTKTKTPGTAAIKGRVVRVPTHSRYGAIYRAVVTPRIRPWTPPPTRPRGGGGGSRVI
jgi:hypothetical protein